MEEEEDTVRERETLRAFIVSIGIGIVYIIIKIFIA